MNDILERVTALAKRRGFFYPSADIYGGVNGIYDKGHLGSLMEERIFSFWRSHMQGSDFPMLQFDGSVMGSESMWRASGHVENFHDPLIDCKNCKIRLRSDDVDIQKPCSRCGIKAWSESRQFNMMFSTIIGPVADDRSKGYLRPETAQNIFVQFKNIIASNRVKIPFGVFQKGLAFRNEITPRHFLFRTRVFTQMEMEFFCHEREADEYFRYWLQHRSKFYEKLGFSNETMRLKNHAAEELSHYSKMTTDVELKYPFGWREAEGIAYRGSWDLSSHQRESGKNFSYYDGKETFVPHVIEASVGVERLMLALLCNGYREEPLQEEKDMRIVLAIPAFIAPNQIAVFPMTDAEKEIAKNIYTMLIKKGYTIVYDDGGSIGKRYRRQDEIGTPFCITVDQTSAEEERVTVRERDSMKQKYVKIIGLVDFFADLFDE